MTDNSYKEYERRIRHIMCIFLSLETLILCFIVIWSCIVNWDYGMVTRDLEEVLTRLRYHLITPDRILNEDFWVFCIGSIVCTILSIRFKWFYRFYEGLHCLGGVIGFCGIIMESLLGALIYFMIMSARFIIYISLIRKY